MAANALDRLRQVCNGSAMSLDELFDLPLPAIVLFAEQHDIALDELRDVCAAMLGELTALENYLVALERSLLH